MFVSIVCKCTLLFMNEDPRSLRIANRIEERRILAQSDERCRLTEGQILRFLIKIGICFKKEV